MSPVLTLSDLVDRLSTRSSLVGASAPPTSCLLASTSNVKHERGLCEATQDRILSSSVFAENMAGVGRARRRRVLVGSGAGHISQ